MFEVGDRVLSPKIGSVKEFIGEIVSIAENASGAGFAVVQDSSGRSWHRDFHELQPIDAASAPMTAEPMHAEHSL